MAIVGRCRNYRLALVAGMCAPVSQAARPRCGRVRIGSAIVFEALELPGGKSQVINSDRTIVGVEARTWGVTARVQCSV
jgi:hypothetical protein